MLCLVIIFAFIISTTPPIFPPIRLNVKNQVISGKKGKGKAIPYRPGQDLRVSG
jgi:hypothetical protein